MKISFIQIDFSSQGYLFLSLFIVGKLEISLFIFKIRQVVIFSLHFYGFPFVFTRSELSVANLRSFYIFCSAGINCFAHSIPLWILESEELYQIISFVSEEEK